MIDFPLVSNLCIPSSILWIHKCFTTMKTFQGIKRMMLQTTHGLFLTCTQKFYIYICIIHNQLFGHKPSFEGKEKHPTYLEVQRLVHSGKSPSTLVPCLVSTTLLLLSNPPAPLPTPWPICITMTTSTTSDFLSGTIRHLLVNYEHALDWINIFDKGTLHICVTKTDTMAIIPGMCLQNM